MIILEMLTVLRDNKKFTAVMIGGCVGIIILMLIMGAVL